MSKRPIHPAITAYLKLIEKNRPFPLQPGLTPFIYFLFGYCAASGKKVALMPQGLLLDAQAYAWKCKTNDKLHQKLIKRLLEHIRLFHAYKSTVYPELIMPDNERLNEFQHLSSFFEQNHA